MVVAPALMAVSTTRHRKSRSERVASSAENSMSEQNFLAKATLCATDSSTSSGVIFSLYSMCTGLVARKVWMRALSARRMEFQAASMSCSRQRASEQMVAPRTVSAMAAIAAASPGEAAAKPASMISTLRASSCFATSIFSFRFMLQPGDCSPSRSVVSKILIVLPMVSCPLLL